MVTYHKFHSCISSCKYVFKNGKIANFVSGQYITSLENEIAELDEEIAQNHPHIFVKKDEKTVDSAVIDPMAALKKKIIAEYEASLKKESTERDMGSTVKSTVIPGMQDSGSIAATAVQVSGKSK